MPQPPAPQAAVMPPRVAKPTLTPGSVLQGRYAVDLVLGAGGMGAVYRAHDLRFANANRLCAIKELSCAGAPAEVKARRSAFDREAHLLASLSHPAVPKIYDYFTEGERVCMVIEFIEGVDLDTAMRTMTGFFSPQQVATWAVEICDVLDYLHGQRPQPIVFRDVKPANLMLTPLGRVFVIDFGIARNVHLGVPGTHIGTEGYAPPEQYRGIAEPRGDIYALGATLHHLLTRTDPRLEPPFSFKERPIRDYNPDASESLVRIVNRCLEYSAEHRFGSAKELSAALQHLDRPGSSIRQTANTSSLVSSMLRELPSTPSRKATPKVQALQPSSRWTYRTQDEVRSSPRVSDGLVIAGSYDATLYALDASSGALAWTHQTGAGICASAVAVEGLVVVGSEDGRIHALDQAAGYPAWSYDTWMPVRSSAVVNGRMIACGSDDGNVHVIDGATGASVWKYKTWGPVRSTPVTLAPGMLAVGSNDGCCYALDWSDGSLLWKYTAGGGIIAPLVTAGGLLLVAAMDGVLYAVDGATGEARWTFPTKGKLLGAPAAASSRVYFGGADSNLYCLDLKSGATVWTYAVGAPVTAGVALHQDKVLCAANDGNLHCVDAHDGGPLWAFKVGGPLVSTPCVHQDIIYIGSNDRRIHALDANW